MDSKSVHISEILRAAAIMLHNVAALLKNSRQCQNMTLTPTQQAPAPTPSAPTPSLSRLAREDDIFVEKGKNTHVDNTSLLVRAPALHRMDNVIAKEENCNDVENDSLSVRLRSKAKNGVLTETQLHQQLSELQPSQMQPSQMQPSQMQPPLITPLTNLPPKKREELMRGFFQEALEFMKKMRPESDPNSDSFMELVYAEADARLSAWMEQNKL